MGYLVRTEGIGMGGGGDSLNKRSGVILNSAKQPVFATNTRQKIDFRKNQESLIFLISPNQPEIHTHIKIPDFGFLI